MTNPLPDIRHDALMLTRRSRLILFVCLALLGYIITGLLTTVLIYKFGAESARILRVAAIAQDIFALIAPAVITAMMITRLPAELLELRGGVKKKMWMLSLAVIIVAAPAMNCVIDFNQNLDATGALSPIADKLRSMEENASLMIERMQGNGSWTDLLMNILIIGIAAGVSEELFFRGCLQRLLTTGGVNTHAAVWIAAAVFSTVHMQFFGFVPRLLLGAYFGYLLVWGRSVWLPAGAHALNNSIYVVAMWLYKREGTPELTVDNIGLGDTWPVALLSLAATMWLIARIRRLRR